MTTKRILLALVAAMLGTAANAQLKPRPDAFPPVPEAPDAKAVTMAATIDEMASWDRYPTYPVYLQMMQRWADEFPTLCHVDTIGTSVEGRLILSLYIQSPTVDEVYRPEFFYSSTIHGDEVTGYIMMLRLIDTLLHGYGSNPQYTSLINRTRISINPLANPDGTYHQSDNTVLGSRRYNAHNVDLNRNYPNPFGVATKGSNPKEAKAAIEPENQAMIDYFDRHDFRLSANLHGGSEVMNYPWDSYTSWQMPHPDAAWWQQVCQRFVDTSRTYDASHFRDVTTSGYIEGGDWYVITGGRQDYFTYYYPCLELTMELSTQKTLSSNRLPEYWGFLQHSLVNYIEEIHTAPTVNGITSPLSTLHSPLSIHPNPAADRAFLAEPASEPVHIFGMDGQRLATLPAGTTAIDLADLPAGIYLLRCGTATSKLVKTATR